MKQLNQDKMNQVSGGGLPAVLVYAAARKAISIGVKKYSKRAAAGAASGAGAGATNELIRN